MNQGTQEPAGYTGKSFTREEDLGREALKTVSHLGLAAMFSMALGLLLRLILPRALGRDHLGTLYFAESFSAMFFTVLPLGVTSYIVREVPVDHRQTARILPTLVPAVAAWAAVLWCAMMTVLWQTGADTQTLVCAASMGVFNSCAVFQRAILRRSYIAMGQAARMARMEMAVRVLLIILVSVCVVWRAPLMMIAGCYGLSELVGVAVLLRRARQQGYLAGEFNATLLREIIAQTLPFFAVGALVEIYGNINSTMLNYLSGKHEVAYFGAADRLKGMGLLLVPVMQAGLQPILAKSWKDSRIEFAATIKTVIRVLAVLSLPMTLGLMLFPDVLSDVVFGLEFRASHRSIAYLAPVLTLTYLNVIIGSALNIISDGKKFLFVTAISLLVNILLNLILIPWGQSRWGDGGGAAASAIATVVSEFYVLIAVQRIFPISIEPRKIAKLLMCISLPVALAGTFYEALQAISILWRLMLAMLIPVYALVTGIVTINDLRRVKHLRF